MIHKILCLGAVCVILHPAIAGAQVVLGPKGPVNPEKKQDPDRRNRNAPKLFRLTVDPAPELVPALKHTLLPRFLDLKAGNAVPYYYRALLAYKEATQQREKGHWESYEKLIEAPVSQFAKEEAQRFLRGYERAFEELKTATHRERCDWDWRMRDLKGTGVYSFVLSEMQDSRFLARLLALKARLAIAENRYEDAIRTLRDGYKMARDVARPPTLINDLIGMIIADSLNEQIRALIDAPGSPNFYWALTELSEPFLDLRSALQLEMAVPIMTFPFLRDAETTQRSADEWRRILGAAVQELTNLGGELAPNARDSMNLSTQLATTAWMLKGYPRAKRELIGSGYTREQIEKMPVGQVIAIHEANAYAVMSQEMMKWSLLPFPQALEQTERSKRKLRDEGYFGRAGATREILPIGAVLLPSTFNVTVFAARLSGRLAGLRVVEAIRMYAAAHDGRLPQSLDVITEVPVPRNPMTGQPFPYRLEGERAVLEVPVASKGMAQSDAWRFEITITPAKKDAPR